MDNNTPQLTDQEKDFLEKYNEENFFLKSISDFYKERGTLSEKQIIHLRKETQKDRTKYSRCEILHLNLNQDCVFHDKEYKEHKKVKIKHISAKAIQIEDVEGNVYAWMPKAGVQVEVDINTETGEETSNLYLKTWFTRYADFWKQNRPTEVIPQKVEEKTEDEELIEEMANSLMDLDEKDFEDDIEDNIEDDNLPF